MRKGPVYMSIDLPEKWHGFDLCQNCQRDAVRLRFSQICELIAPFKPDRVPGFIQDEELVLEKKKIRSNPLVRKIVLE